MLFGYFDLWAYYYMHYYYLFDCTARSKDVLACVLDWPIASWYFQLLLYFIVSHPSAFSLFIWSTCLTLHGSHCLPCWQKQREGESLHVEPACMEAAERKRESLHMRKLCLMCRFCTALCICNNKSENIFIHCSLVVVTQSVWNISLHETFCTFLLLQICQKKLRWLCC